MLEINNIYYENAKFPVGTKIKFKEELHKYTIQASNIMFAVCTKPFNARKTVLYTVINWQEKVRGTENLVFGMGAETKEACEKMLERLTQGESEVSYRNRIELNVEEISEPSPK